MLWGRISQYTFSQLMEVGERHGVSDHQRQPETSFHCTRAWTSTNWFSPAGTCPRHQTTNATMIRTVKSAYCTNLHSHQISTEHLWGWHGTNCCRCMQLNTREAPQGILWHRNKGLTKLCCSNCKQGIRLVFRSELLLHWVYIHTEQTPGDYLTSQPSTSLYYIITLWVKSASRSFRETSMKNPSGKYF